MNTLLKFTRHHEYPNLSYPKPCPKVPDGQILILFAIKSMPSHYAMREVIRQTWLNSKYWRFQNKMIFHSIFLMGQQDNISISEEIETFGDVLQYDFIESHYNLTVKDVKLLQFIQKGISLNYLF